jgi:acyl-CoA synthetase (AMP-forming)/AMP-acid ligase II
VTQPASPTLDALFKRTLARQPDAPALVDPLNKQRITGQTRKRLTYAQADRAISAISAHFIESGLPANSVIAIQLPNTIEFALTVLAAHRAGLVVVPLPLLWRHAELTAALNRTAARHRDHRPDRRRRLRGPGHERRGGSVLHPPCLRFRQRPARGHGLA